MANPKDATFRDLFCPYLFSLRMEAAKSEIKTLLLFFFYILKKYFLLKPIINKRVEGCEGGRFQIRCLICTHSVCPILLPLTSRSCASRFPSAWSHLAGPGPGVDEALSEAQAGVCLAGEQLCGKGSGCWGSKLDRRPQRVLAAGGTYSRLLLGAWQEDEQQQEVRASASVWGKTFSP